MAVIERRMRAIKGGERSELERLGESIAAISVEVESLTRRMRVRGGQSARERDQQGAQVGHPPAAQSARGTEGAEHERDLPGDHDHARDAVPTRPGSMLEL